MDLNLILEILIFKMKIIKFENMYIHNNTNLLLILRKTDVQASLVVYLP